MEDRFEERLRAVEIRVTEIAADQVGLRNDLARLDKERIEFEQYCQHARSEMYPRLTAMEMELVGVKVKTTFVWGLLGSVIGAILSGGGWLIVLLRFVNK